VAGDFSAAARRAAASISAEISDKMELSVVFGANSPVLGITSENISYQKLYHTMC
jgi:hypothetical protein